jgi:hypothetical protein
MASLKKCIENFCKTCTYDSSQAGSWRHQVEQCTVKSCALYEVRPVTMESMLAKRKEKGATALDLDALVDGLEDDDTVEA